MRGPSATAPARETKEREEYKAKEDARTLTEAEAIRGDAHRHHKAREHLRNSVTAMQRAMHEGRGHKESKRGRRRRPKRGGRR